MRQNRARFPGTEEGDFLKAEHSAADHRFTDIYGTVRDARVAVYALGLGSDLAERAALVVTELATNAVLHAGATPYVRIWYGGPGLRVEVSDGSEVVPKPRPGSTMGGRGLQIVSAMTKCWGSSPRPGGKSSGPNWSERRRWLVMGVVAIMVIGSLGLARARFDARYQPLVSGGMGGTSFPGLPAKAGIVKVNDFGAQQGELYVPPTPGPFTVLASVYNPWPRAATVRTVTLDDRVAPGVPPWRVVPAGPVLYMPEYASAHRPHWKAGRPVNRLVLAPHQSVEVGVPVSFSYACYIPDGWTTVADFYVQESVAGSAHWVAIPLATPLLMNERVPRGTSTAVCPE